MKIIISIRDNDAHGKHIPMRNLCVENVSVVKDGCDGIRLNNYATVARDHFCSAASEFVRQVKDFYFGKKENK